MFATYVRNSEIGEKIIYFGPMGCQTGFYLLVRDTEPQKVLEIVTEEMENACQMKVKLRADGAIGKDWYTAH